MYHSTSKDGWATSGLLSSSVSGPLLTGTTNYRIGPVITLLAYYRFLTISCGPLRLTELQRMSTAEC